MTSRCTGRALWARRAAEEIGGGGGGSVGENRHFFFAQVINSLIQKVKYNNIAIFAGKISFRSWICVCNRQKSQLQFCDTLLHSIYSNA